MRQELNLIGAETEIYVNNRPWLCGEKFDGEFAVFFDKDINFAKAMEDSGVKVFNSSASCAVCDDKIKSALRLTESGILCSETIPAPKSYKKGADREYLELVASRLGFPLVVKPANGSLGMGVKLAENFEELLAFDEELSPQDRLYQKYQSKSKGRSIRAIVVGGEILSAIELSNDGDFRSNASVGGRGRKINLGSEHIIAAESAARALGLDYCGVDLFCDEPKVIEVNSNAYFRKIEEVTGVNVAAAFASLIVKRTGKL